MGVALAPLHRTGTSSERPTDEVTLCVSFAVRMGGASRLLESRASMTRPRRCQAASAASSRPGNASTVLAVSSLFVFRRRPGWQRLRAVSVAFPLVPASYLLVGAWMIYYGLMLRPAISAAAVLTLVTGAAVYYARLRLRDASKELPT